MANCHILFDNYADAGNYSVLAGSWLPSLPLTNLKTPLPREVARSTNLLTTSTFFTVDLLAIRPISMFALIGNNFTNAAQVTIAVSNNSSFTDQTLVVTIPAFQPNVPWGSVAWGAFPWDGFREDYQPGGPITFYRHPETVYGRYIRIFITDTTNPAGFVQIGRFMVGEPFVPKVNMAFGAGIRFIDPSVKAVSKGGSAFWDKRPKLRATTVQFPALSEGEAMGAAYDLQNRIGLTGNLLFVYDPDDEPSVILRRTIYGSPSQLDDIVTASADVAYPYTWNFAVEELL